MKSFGATFAGCLVIALAVLGLSFGTGRAQGGLQEPAARVIDLELDELEIGKAVAYLFAKVNGKYSLAPDVRGVTTVSLRQVPFEGALANVLKQVNATWRIRDGVYEIVLKPQPEIDWSRVAAEDRESDGEDAIEAISRLFKRAGFSVEISSGVKGRIKLSENELKGLTFEVAIQRVLKQANATYLVEGGVYMIVPQDPAQKVVDLDAKGEDIREVLRRLFKNVGVSYSIAPEIQGTVTIQLRNVTFATALANVLKQVDATYRIEGGIYQIIKPNIYMGGGPVDSAILGREVDRSEAPVMTIDDQHLFILKGGRLYKVGKSDLKTIASSMTVGPDSRDQTLVMFDPGPVMVADDRFLYILRGITLSKTSKADLKVVSTTRLMTIR